MPRPQLTTGFQRKYLVDTAGKPVRDYKGDVSLSWVIRSKELALEKHREYVRLFGAYS